MSSLFVEEYADLARDRGGNVSPVAGRALVVQKITIGGVSAASSVFQNGTHYVGLQADAACYFAIGASPTATTSSMYLAADQLVFRKVTPGEKVACLTK